MNELYKAVLCTVGGAEANDVSAFFLTDLEGGVYAEAK